MPSPISHGKPVSSVSHFTDQNPTRQYRERLAQGRKIMAARPMAKSIRDSNKDTEPTHSEHWDARVVWRTRVKAPVGIKDPSGTSSSGWNPFDIWHSRIKRDSANDTDT
jgi:hypothetical protein